MEVRPAFLGAFELVDESDSVPHLQVNRPDEVVHPLLAFCKKGPGLVVSLAMVRIVLHRHISILDPRPAAESQKIRQYIMF